jgi:hypothetical protein
MNEDGMWQELLHKKYLHSKTLSQVSAKPADPPFSKGLMNVKEDFFLQEVEVLVSLAMGLIIDSGRTFS